jgi:hypothetical protein
LAGDESRLWLCEKTKAGRSQMPVASAISQKAQPVFGGLREMLDDGPGDSALPD